MDAEKYTRSVAMICPTCGNREFEFGEEGDPIRCMSCDREFTREELIEENGEVIDAELHEMKDQILGDVTKELRNALGKAFKGSKHIRFK